MPTSSFETQLESHLRRCSSPRRQARIHTRWAHIAALNTLSCDDILRLCRSGSVEQNPIVAALLRLHQAGDEDASTLLLGALRPLVALFARRRSGGRLNAQFVDTFWAAAGHMLATVDADHDPVNDDAGPTTLLAYLGQRLSCSHAHLDSGTRRQHRRSQRGDNELVRPGEFPLDFTDADHHVVATSADIVEVAALSHLEFERVAIVVRDGLIDAERWNELLEHRLGSDERCAPVSTQRRVAVHRTSQRLAELVDHVAA